MSFASNLHDIKNVCRSLGIASSSYFSFGEDPFCLYIKESQSATLITVMFKHMPAGKHCSEQSPYVSIKDKTFRFKDLASLKAILSHHISSHIKD